MMRSRITTSGISGGSFVGESLVVGRHAERKYQDGTVERGVFVTRKWVFDKEANRKDPSAGWAYEHWFEWPKGTD